MKKRSWTQRVHREGRVVQKSPVSHKSQAVIEALNIFNVHHICNTYKKGQGFNPIVMATIFPFLTSSTSSASPYLQKRDDWSWKSRLNHEFMVVTVCSTEKFVFGCLPGTSLNSSFNFQTSILPFLLGLFRKHSMGLIFWQCLAQFDSLWSLVLERKKIWYLQKYLCGHC